MKRLTVIITFLNEGEEIKNTLESMCCHLNEEVDILLIDDASTDGYDYETIAMEFNAKYIRNKDRLGVAGSRDLGVRLSETPYFLLLDGHMRFYDNRWVNAIVSELEKDDRQLLCCQTKFLSKNEKNELYERGGKNAYGAYLDLDGGNKAFKVMWKYWEGEVGAEVEDIPCVLGATYAASKRYWQYLRGLEGLECYGSDEPYISLKVWLEGGRCRLLKNIVIGHIYRKRFPYTVGHTFIVYNMLFVLELLLPRKMKYWFFAETKKIYAPMFKKAYKMLQEKEPLIQELREYYAHIFTEKFQKYLDVQQMPERVSREYEADDREKMARIAMRLVRHHGSLTEVGLLNGKMGLVMFFYRYARYSGQAFFELLADELLDEIYKDSDVELPVTFGKGICGIGWGIEYLVQYGFVEGDTSEILEEIDMKVMERDPLRMSDWTLDAGVAGILEYVLIRLKAAKRMGKPLPFNERYLKRLEKMVRKMILKPEAVDGICAAFQFLEFRETGYLDTSRPDLKEVLWMKTPDGEIDHWPLGVKSGCMGVGLRFMKDA